LSASILKHSSVRKRDAFPTDSDEEQLSSSVVAVLKENIKDSSSYSKVSKNLL
jgi:hypothetical protein